MLEIEKLERDWRRYRAKRLRPWLLSLLALVLVASVSLLLRDDRFAPFAFKTSDTPENKRASEPKESVTHPTSPPQTQDPTGTERTHAPIEEPDGKKETAAEKEEPPRQQNDAVSVAAATGEEESSVTLNPDIDFLSTLSQEKKGRSDPGNSATEKGPVRHETIASVATQKRHEKPQAKKRSETSDYAQEDESAPSSLVIQTSKANNTLDYLIKRFDEKRDPKLASYIAQSYYKKGRYEEAIKWSVMANSLDPSSEETWLIFARSKVRLGEKEDAIKALRAYLNQYSSKNVKTYLQSLESGR